MKYHNFSFHFEVIYFYIRLKMNIIQFSIIGLLLIAIQVQANREASVTRTVVLREEGVKVNYTSNQIDPVGQANISELAQ